MSGREKDLERFIEAQEPIYAQALAELEEGCKRSHWMWFVFPQLKGLGHSWRSEYYGIANLTEAVAFLAHPTLGERYVECVRALMANPKDSASVILGPIDALKLCSSLTLFEAAARASGRSDEQNLFATALERFFGGRRCPLTEARLRWDRATPRP
ncbi:MAG: hypothetical protein KatS3mg125_1237 [Lysobacterales bacterium]|jgi:uncharacterized protein (DUF1810 family)|nr:MAG: hypothetical protein KatS3mg125_1237 [Xanthomonadales bacterium]